MTRENNAAVKQTTTEELKTLRRKLMVSNLPTVTVDASIRRPQKSIQPPEPEKTSANSEEDSEENSEDMEDSDESGICTYIADTNHLPCRT